MALESPPRRLRVDAPFAGRRGEGWVTGGSYMVQVDGGPGGERQAEKTSRLGALPSLAHQDPSVVTLPAASRKTDSPARSWPANTQRANDRGGRRTWYAPGVIDISGDSARPTRTPLDHRSASTWPTAGRRRPRAVQIGAGSPERAPLGSIRIGRQLTAGDDVGARGTGPLPDSYRQALASSTRHRCTATQAPLQPSVTRDRQVRRRRTDTTRPGSDGNVVLLGFLVSVIAAIRRHDRSPSAARAGGRCCGRGPPVLGGSAGPPHADVELSDDVFDRVDGIVPPGTITKPGRRRVLAPAGRKVLGPSMRETCRVARAVRD